MLAQPTSLAPAAPPLPRTPHILVVDDDARIRSMVTELLENEGYAVLQASDGVEAVDLLRKSRPDLIVLDLTLPRMSGWQFLERTRPELEHARIPVLILSAIVGGSDYPSTLGVAGWLTKPIDLERFLGAVERLAGPSDRTPRGSAARVLVIEDELPIRNLLAEHLAGEGFASDAVEDVPQAIERIASQAPDLIVLDLMLPGHSGWEFLRDRASDPRLARIPVLVISAAPHDRLLEAKESGADAFLSKPFDFDALTTLVHSFVG